MRKIPKLRFPEFSGEWEEDKLNNHAEIYDGTHQTPAYKDNGIKFVSVENINNLLETDKYISKDDYEKEYKNKKVDKGDILMTRIGDIGTPALIDFDKPLAYYVTLSLIKCKSQFVKSNFLYYYIQNDSFQKELYKRTLHIAFPKKINLGEIGLSSITFPEISEQQKIADFLSLFDEKIEIEKEILETLKELKKGLLQQMFV